MKKRVFPAIVWLILTSGRVVIHGNAHGRHVLRPGNHDIVIAHFNLTTQQQLVFCGGPTVFPGQFVAVKTGKNGVGALGIHLKPLLGFNTGKNLELGALDDFFHPGLLQLELKLTLVLDGQVE